MSKVWIANCTSFKGKHPEGEKTFRVVVKTKMKKDAIELAKKELALFDKHHAAYKAPALTEIADEAEAEAILNEYLAVRERVAQIDIDDVVSDEPVIDGVYYPAGYELDGEQAATSENEFIEPEAIFDAPTATVAEFPIIEPYSVRIAIAKSGEQFVHSMVIYNRKTQANMVGQQAIFNPKKFNDIDNCVVYGLAMAIDAVNAHFVKFLSEKQIEVSTKILSGYAQDAEGNFIERFVSDLDLSEASFMAINKPVERADFDEVVRAITNHKSFAALVDGYQYPKENLVAHLTGHWKYLSKKHGNLPVNSLCEHIISMANVADLVNLESCDEILSHYIAGTTTTEIEQLTKPIENNQPKIKASELCHYGRSILKSVSELSDFESLVTTEEVKVMAENLRAVNLKFTKEFGNAFLCGHTVAKMEADHSWESVDEVKEIFMDRGLLKAVIRKQWLTLNEGLLKTWTKELPEQPEMSEYAGTCWKAYIDEIMTQFNKPEISISSDEYHKAAKNISELFNDWKVSLFIKGDQRTEDADLFKDYVFLELRNDQHKEALELLQDREKAEALLISVLSDGYESLKFGPVVSAMIGELVEKLICDESLGCTYESGKIKALIYSELNGMHDEQVAPMINIPENAIKWWHALNDDFCKAQKQRKAAKESEQPEIKAETLTETAPESPQQGESDFVMAEQPESTETIPGLVQAPEITRDDMTKQKMPHCVFLEALRDEADRYELAVLSMFKETPEGIHFDFDGNEFALMAKNLKQTIDRYDEFVSPILKGQTLINIINGIKGISGHRLERILKHQDNAECLWELENLVRDHAEHKEAEQPEITRDDMTESKPYAQWLDENRDTANPYELAVLTMLEKTGEEFEHFTEFDYSEMAETLESRINAFDAFNYPIKKGETVTALINELKDNSVEMIRDLLTGMGSGLMALIESCAVPAGPEHKDAETAEIPPAEGLKDEQEEQRQDIEHDIYDPAANPDRAVSAGGSDVRQATTASQATTLKTLAMQLMKLATKNFGPVGFGWGYQINRQWVNKKGGECHVEIGLWVKDEKRGKGEPVSFFGISPLNNGNYVNDAMLLALANGLEMTLFSLGVTLED